MKRPLTEEEHELLVWLLCIAKEYRGALVGHPEPRVINEFDQSIREAHGLLDKLKP